MCVREREREKEKERERDRDREREREREKRDRERERVSFIKCGNISMTEIFPHILPNTNFVPCQLLQHNHVSTLLSIHISHMFLSLISIRYLSLC